MSCAATGSPIKVATALTYPHALRCRVAAPSEDRPMSQLASPRRYKEIRKAYIFDMIIAQ